MEKQPTGGESKPWWREWQAAVLVLLVVAGYAVRMGDISLRGEEPTRAHVAFGILESGDWVVPRVLGEPFRSRPPLQNWLIAVSTIVCQSREAWVLRLPSVLAMLLTTLMIYGYARTFLSRAGALAAAAAFPTFGEMFTTGCQAETDMVFTALVSSSLILWHWGQVRAWPAVLTWTISYALVALGILCKGPQAPAYFLAATWPFLICTGQGRLLLSRAHWIGAAAGTAIFLGWLVPCILRTSWPVTWAIIMSDSTMRFKDWKIEEFGEHFVTFPLEVLGCTLPWSLLLIGYCSQHVRRWAFAGCGQESMSQGSSAAAPAKACPRRRHGLFMAVCVGVAFPSIWLPPGGQTRYLTPLYPCLAVLIGIVAECCMTTDLPALVRRGRRWWSLLLAGVMCITALAVVAAALVPAADPILACWAEPPWRALAFALIVLFLAWLMVRTRQRLDAGGAQIAILALGSFMTLTFTGYINNVRIRASQDQATPIARCLERIPPEERLTCFGQVDLLFAYYYARPIDWVPCPAHENDRGARSTWFCFDCDQGSKPSLPFAWQEEAVIIMDRSISSSPQRTVIIGRRCGAPTTAATSSAMVLSNSPFPHLASR